MRPVRALAVYMVVVFVGGALLAPWLYWLAQLFAHEIPRIAHSPFHRFVNRSLLGLALIGLWPLFKSAGAASLGDAGLVHPAGQWGKLGGGFLLGLVSLAAVAGLAVAAGASHLNTLMPPARVGERLVGIALTAAVVAVLEELLFRGAIFGLMRKVFHWMFALAVSSMVYAVVHFLAPAEMTGPITWSSGLELLPRMLRGFVDFHALVPGFINLTLAGVVLGFAYYRTGNLYFSIGLHAGWIFWLKSYGMLTTLGPGVSSSLWGSSKLIDGWFALPVLGATLLLFTQLPLTQKRGFYT